MNESFRYDNRDQIEGVFERFSDENPETSVAQVDLDPVSACEAVKVAVDAGNVQDLRQALLQLNNSFYDHQSESLYCAFEKFDIFQIILHLLKEDSDSRVTERAWLLLANFTSSNVDFVQMFVECGLFKFLLDILQKDDMKANLNALSIIRRCVPMSPVYLRRSHRILVHSTILKLLAFGDIKICQNLALYVLYAMEKFEEAETPMNRIHELLCVIPELLKTEDERVIEFCLNGLIKYVLSSSFRPASLHSSQVDQTVVELSSHQSQTVQIQLCRLAGHLFCKKVDIGIPTQFFVDLTQSEHVEVRKMAYWCLNAGIIEDIVDLPLIRGAFLGKCVRDRVEDVFSVKVEFAHCISAILKKMDYTEMKEFIDKNVIEVLVDFLQIDNLDVVKFSVQIIARFIHWTVENGDGTKAVDMFLAAQGREMAEQLAESTDPEMAKQGTLLMRQIDLYKS